MKKKITAVLIMLVLVVFSASAESILQIGATAAIPFPIVDNMEEFTDSFKHLEKYQFGADVRVNVPMGNKVMALQLAAIDMMSFGNGGFYNDTTATANFLFAPKSYVNFSIGAGTSMGFNVKGGHVYIGTDTPINSFVDVLSNSTLIYRAGLNFNLVILRLGLSYYVPTNVTFSSGAGTLSNWAPVFNDAKLAVSVMLFNLF